MENGNLVKKYFEDTAQEFDDIYDNKGGFFKKFINKFLRKGMRERLFLALQECGKKDKTVLDLGGGSGRIAILLAEKGARVTNLDYSIQMIELAKKHLEKYNNEKGSNLEIEMICSDFMKDFKDQRKFDIILALGVFDYLENPLPFLEKMKNYTIEKMIASFPARFAFQTPLRKIWLLTRKCPVYFYTKKDLQKMYDSLKTKNYKIIELTAGYLVVADI